MFTKGVHVVHGGGAVSLAHSTETSIRSSMPQGEVAEDMGREQKYGLGFRDESYELGVQT